MDQIPYLKITFGLKRLHMFKKEIIKKLSEMTIAFLHWNRASFHWNKTFYYFLPLTFYYYLIKNQNPQTANSHGLYQDAEVHYVRRHFHSAHWWIEYGACNCRVLGRLWLLSHKGRQEQGLRYLISPREINIAKRCHQVLVDNKV